MTMRLDKANSGGLDRDQELMGEIQSLSAKHDERHQSHRERGLYDAELEQYRWMLEEYRVSLFAQTLGTAQTVSPQRLEKQWKKVQP